MQGSKRQEQQVYASVIIIGLACGFLALLSFWDCLMFLLPVVVVLILIPFSPRLDIFSHLLDDFRNPLYRMLTPGDHQQILEDLGFSESYTMRLWDMGSKSSPSVMEGWNIFDTDKISDMFNLVCGALCGACASEGPSAIGGVTRSLVSRRLKQIFCNKIEIEFNVYDMRQDFISDKGSEFNAALADGIEFISEEGKLKVGKVKPGSPASDEAVREGWELIDFKPKFKSFSMDEDHDIPPSECFLATKEGISKAKARHDLKSYTLVFSSAIARNKAQHVLMTLEDTLYAVNKEFGVDAAKNIDIVNQIYQNQTLHSVFAFYYKHPLFAANAKTGCFNMRLFLMQIAIAIYVWLPWVSADEARILSSQARLLRHSLRRHGLSGVGVVLISIYVAVSLYSRPFGHNWLLFDKDLNDESVVAIMLFFLHMSFGGL